MERQKEEGMLNEMDVQEKDLLPIEVLMQLLPAAFEPWGSSSWYPSKPPTTSSIERINAELGIKLPTLFINVAQTCTSYGGWFGSIGEDYESHNHLLSINRLFREEGVDKRYILLNHGHDGDCDAWDVEGERAPNDELPIVYFNYDSERRLMKTLQPYAANFSEYIDTFIRSHAPTCGIKSLRREAKRILDPYTPQRNK